MNFINCKEASKKYNISIRRIQQMAKEGQIVGAIKEKKEWLIPIDYFKNNESYNIKKPLPIGISDFKRAVSDYYYVDKTMLIKEFLDSKPQVSLFTRPRRFGKTLTMDMLKVFFEKTDSDTSKYFEDKYIMKCGEYYKSFQGKYPTIFLTFKDVKCSTWDETYQKIVNLISLEYLRHEELENSDKLNNFEKELYCKISQGKGSYVDYQMSLGFLSLILKKHYNVNAVIIIDEYDTPVEQGHLLNFYDKIIEFIRTFFSSGLKDNSNLEFGFLTGILRVAKESVFSGLNNIKIYSILENQYSSYFGFTEKEVKELLEYYDYKDKFDEIKKWYDGYLFGNSEIFNPWSVINYISESCTPKAFWQATGSNDIIGETVANCSNEVNNNLQKLLEGNTITTYLDTNVIYPNIYESPYSIYSFLTVAGYLKINKIYPLEDCNYMCDLAIPNKEIKVVYEKEVLSKIGKTNLKILIDQALFTKDFSKLKDLLTKFLVESVSSFDGSNEAFYQGMMLGLCATLNNIYKISSNKESGLGRYDIELEPKDKKLPGYIFELKYVRDVKKIEEAAINALNQIDEKRYDTNMKLNNIKSIIKVGISFCGKNTCLKYKD